MVILTTTPVCVFNFFCLTLTFWNISKMTITLLLYMSLTSSSFCCLLRSSVSRSEGPRRAISSSLCRSSLRCSNTRVSSGFSSSSRPLCGQSQPHSQHTVHSALDWFKCQCVMCCTVYGWAAAPGAGSGNSAPPPRNRSVSWAEWSRRHWSQLWIDGTGSGDLMIIRQLISPSVTPQIWSIQSLIKTFNRLMEKKLV